MSDDKYNYDDDIMFVDDGIIVCHMVLLNAMLALWMIVFMIIS